MRMPEYCGWNSYSERPVKPSFKKNVCIKVTPEIYQ
uniref:Uncharacterized protein n=1 Tax=Anopheles albimanus TaxID=7167 RepID=A0A182FYQ5_ANOAL